MHGKNESVTLYLSPLEEINNLLRSCEENITFISAFLTSDFLEFMQDHIPKNVEKTLLIRGNKIDFENGSSSFSSVEKAISLGWKVYINSDLHAKLYCFDWKQAVIGSSNLTSRGFSWNGLGNIELNATISLTENDKKILMKLIDASHLITPNDLYLMKNALKSNENYSTNSDSEWPFERELSLSTDEMLDKFSLPLSVHNYELLKQNGYVSSINNLKDSLMRSKEYQWLYHLLEKTDTRSATFGYISHKLHDSIVSDNRIYRKTIKEYVSHLISWLENLDTEISIEFLDHTSLFILKKR